MSKTVILYIIMLTSLTAFATQRQDTLPNDQAYLLKLCSEAMERRDFHSTRSHASCLRTISQREGNDYYLGYADYYLGSAEMFLGASPKAGELLNEAYRLAKHLGNDTLTGNVLNCLAIYEGNVNSNYYLAQHYLMQCKDYPGMEGSAYSNLAQVARLQRDTSGIEYARRCYDYGLRTGERHYLYSGLKSLAEFSILREEYEQARKYLAQAYDIADKYGYHDRDTLDFLEALILSYEGHTTESTEILLRIKPKIESDFPIYVPELYMVLGKNAEKEHRYNDAISLLAAGIEKAQSASSNDYLPQLYKITAQNYEYLRDYRLAASYMTKALEAAENFGRTERKRMMNERRLMLEAVHKEQERTLAEQKARESRRLNIVLALLLAIAAAAIAHVIVTLRRRNRLYEHIVQQNLNMLAEEERYRHRLEELETQQSDHNERDRQAAANRESKSRELFNRLQQLMTDEALYRDANLTREAVIERLGTNPTYLAQAIKENADMNYAQFINSFRMREAVRILSDRSRLETPIKDIAGEVGCNSLTTFYKLFQQATGLSPSAYRRSLLNI
ncbi:MAG: helix-turn-helix domain-containing protein [Muribaculaceae bacterium]|nr:helix-turn-helix domain-containing protein [Muribaculaceae bacterium]